MSGECLSFEQSTNGPRNNTASPARVTLRRAQDDTQLTTALTLQQDQDDTHPTHRTHQSFGMTPFFI